MHLLASKRRRTDDPRTAVRARRGAAVLGAAALLGAPRPCPGQVDPGTRRSGFEPSVHVGAGGFANGLRLAGGEPWAPGVREPSLAVQVHLAYRVLAPLDVGVRAAHQWFAVAGLPAQTTATATAPGGGVFVRVHPTALGRADLPVDVHLGVGFDFLAAARQTTRTEGGGAVAEVRSAALGVAVPCTLGLDLILGDLALGVLGLWAPTWHTEVCGSVGGSEPRCDPRSGPPDYYLFVGVGARVNLRFAR